MLIIPVVYDDATRRIAVSEEWAGTVIDDRSTMFSVSGIPEDVRSARLDVKVAVKSSQGKTIYPFMLLEGIESGTGTAKVPHRLFEACKRDYKFIIQLELMTDDETYASENQLRFKVSPSITKSPSGMPHWNQDQVLIDAYEVDNEKIVFKRFNGDEFSILLRDNPVEWENIQNVPWRKEWTEGTPKDKEIVTESLILKGLDTKTDVLLPVPRWDENTVYNKWSVVLDAHTLYESLYDDNQGHSVEDVEWWMPVTSGGSPEPTGKGRYTQYIGNGTDKEFVIEHGLKTKIFLYNLFDTEEGEAIDAQVFAVGENKAKVVFNEPPALWGAAIIISTGAGGEGGGGEIEAISTAEIDDLFR